MWHKRLTHGNYQGSNIGSIRYLSGKISFQQIWWIYLDCIFYPLKILHKYCGLFIIINLMANIWLHIREHISYFHFWICDTSLRIIFSSCSHLHTHFMMSSFKLMNNTPLYKYISFLYPFFCWVISPLFLDYVHYE